MVDTVNKNLSLSGITENKVKSLYEQTVIWQNKNWNRNNLQNELWEKVRNNEWISDILKVKAGKPCPFLNKLNYSKLIQENKQTIVSEVHSATNTISLVQSKPLGSAGDITINELINKEIEVIDTPLVQLIKENVSVKVTGSFLTSMILYKTIVNLYLKSAYSGSLIDTITTGPNTCAKEVALFMIIGALFITRALLTINNK